MSGILKSYYSEQRRMTQFGQDPSEGFDLGHAVDRAARAVWDAIQQIPAMISIEFEGGFTRHGHRYATLTISTVNLHNLPIEVAVQPIITSALEYAGIEGVSVTISQPHGGADMTLTFSTGSKPEEEE